MPKRDRFDAGQALVEFALGLIVLVLLIFAVIEGGRLLHGWITVQGAVREGSRYAITGQYDESCLADVPACPDARVFSIKERVRTATTGLAVDPKAGYDTPRYLRVEVSGVNKENAWQEEFPGEPGRPVMVRASYHMPLVTPLFRPIADSIRVSGQVVVNNENYAQVSTSNRGIELADLPAPPPPSIPAADLQIDSEVVPLVALVDEPIVFSLRVSNLGPDEARGVVVVDELPPDVTFVSASPADLCRRSGRTVTCDVPNLPRGVGYDISITVNAPAEPPPAPGDIVNRAMVTGSERDDDLSNNEDTVTAVVVLSDSVADLEVVTVDDWPDPVVINQELTYSILVRNNGIKEATDVQLTDQLPEGTVYLSGSVSGGSGCSEADGLVTCLLGNIGVGEMATAQITVRAPSSTGTIINTASVAGEQVDPDERNNTNSEVTTISPEWSDLYLRMADSPDPVLLGNEIQYSIEVVNNGPSDASGVTVVDTLPSEVSFVSATPSQGRCSESDLVVTCDLEALQRGQNATIDILVVAESVGTISNRATVSSDQTDPNTVNDSDVVVTTVEPTADLSIVKTAVPPTPPGVNAGEILTYRLLVANDGPSPATNVIVEDRLPIDLSFLNVSTTRGTCTFESAAVNCTLGNLASEESVEITIQGIPQLEGVLVNDATVAGDQPDMDRTNNASQDNTTVLEPTNAFITLDPVCGEPGSSVTIQGFNWPSEGNKDIDLYWDAIDPGNQIGVVENNGAIWTTALDIPISAIEGSHTIYAVRQKTTVEAAYSVPCPAPNLTTSQVEMVQPESAQVGDPVTFQVEIANDGDLDVVNQFFVGLYFDPPFEAGSPVTHIPPSYRVELVAISWLAVGDSRTVTITADDGFDTPGLHDVYIVADSDPGPEGVIGELREYDNVSPLLQVEVEPAPIATPTPGPEPTPTSTPEEFGSLIGQVFLVAAGGQPLPQAGVEVSVYDATTGAQNGVTFSDRDGSYFLSDLTVGTKTVSACIIIDDVSYTHTVTGIDIVAGEIAFEDLFLDEGPCN